MSSKSSKKKSNVLVRIVKRLFHGPNKELSVLEEEQYQTPMKTVMKNFLENKVAMTGLVVFVAIFAAVIIIPFIRPLDKSYQEVTQQNIAPGRNLLKYPKALKNNVKDISIGATYSIGVTEDGEVHLWGKYGKEIAKLPNNMGKVVQVSAGDDHVLALNSNGKIFGWGSRRFKQTNIPSELFFVTNIKQIFAGSQISLAVTEDGMVYFWGNQNLVDFNADKYQGQIDKVSANTSVILALLKNGEVVVLGNKASAFTKIPENMGKVVDFALTGQSACAVNEAGEGFVCFVMIFTPSTNTLLFLRSTEITFPSLPLSLPAITLTVSPFLIFIVDIPAPPYNSSGARETIFINCFSRSSLATGPKIRVPLGVLSSLMITAAFSSNLI